MILVKAMSQVNKLNETELLNEIRMKLNKKVLFVEGKTDKTFFEVLQFNTSQKYEIYTMSSIQTVNCRKSVIEIICKLNSMETNIEYFGVIDIDDSFIDKEVINTERLLTYYGARDLENMLFQSNIFCIYFSMLNKNNIAECTKIRNSIYEVTYPLAIVRYISRKENLNYSFDNISYKKICGKKNREEIIEYIISHLSIDKTQKNKILELIREYSDVISVDPSYICNGHDLLEIASYIINRDTIKINADYYSPTQIIHSLALALINPISIIQNLIDYCLERKILSPCI